MSDSDSQSNKSFNMGEVPQEQQSHIKQILQKGKKIVPSYDQAALYNMYKRYYSVDHIFYNELNIIAKRMSGVYDEDNDKKNNQQWVTVGRKVRTKINKSKYNFLQDQQLIRRAQQYLKNKFILPEKRFNTNAKYQDNREYNRKNYNDNNANANANAKYQHEDRRPKLKFVEKVQDKPANKTGEIVSKNIEIVNKPVEIVNKPVEKNIKPVEKNIKPAENIINKPFENANKPAPTQEKQQNHQNNKNNKYVEKDLSKKIQEKTSVVTPDEIKKSQPTKTIVKKQEFIVVDVKKSEAAIKQEKLLSSQVTSKPEQVKTPTIQKYQPQTRKSPASKQPTISSSAKIIIDQTYDHEVASKNFSQAAKQNSFILSFIKPQPYPQRVSYTRTSTGEIKNVQIRVTGTANTN